MASVALASPRDPLQVDNLQAHPTLYKSGTLAQSSGRAFFCQTPVSSASRPSHVIIVKAHWSCFQNATGILDSSGILPPWTGYGKTVYTCLNMVQTCTYMFMNLCTHMSMYVHVHTYLKMYVVCTYKYMQSMICIYMVFTRPYLHLCACNMYIHVHQ
jgi:hypothetical protein